ncbi:unnamed protein product, partial [Ectocarpus sp. 4 AP-2014]
MERGTVLSPKLLEHFKTAAPATKRVTNKRSTGSTLLSTRRVMHAQNLATKGRAFCGFARAKGFLLPGNTWNTEITFDANTCKDTVYWVVAKLTNTNDAFMGIDGSKFPDKCPSKLFPPAFDAGKGQENSTQLTRITRARNSVIRGIFQREPHRHEAVALQKYHTPYSIADTDPCVSPAIPPARY